MSKNKKWSSAAKFEIALSVLKNETTLNEVCKKYGVSPSQVHAWKKQLLEDGSQLFDNVNKATKVSHDHEEVKRQLYEKIGQLTVERDFLKKSWERFRENIDSN